MKYIVFFMRAGTTDDMLFTEVLSLIPRVGDRVGYSFTPVDTDKWDPAALAGNERATKLVDGWRVTDVCHTIRRLRVNEEASQIVNVYLEPVT